MKTARATTPHDAAVGESIKTVRQCRKMSQEALARACGVTFQQIQKYEKGTNRIGAGRLVQIADALGVSPAALLGGLGKHDQSQSLTAGLSKQAIELARIHDAMPSPDLSKLLCHIGAGMLAAASSLSERPG